MEKYPNTVTYWAEGKDKHEDKKHSSIKFYKYFNYTSGYIHHATIKRLEVSLLHIKYFQLVTSLIILINSFIHLKSFIFIYIYIYIMAV